MNTITLYTSPDSAATLLSDEDWIIVASDMMFEPLVTAISVNDTDYDIQPMRIQHLYHVSRKK